MLPTASPAILTVSQVTSAIRELLETHYRFVHVTGEISNLKTPSSGHSYFTLKDAGAQLRVVLFKQQKRFLAQDLADGRQVVVFGRISVYDPRGEYQLIADSVESYGIGKLLRDFEILKQRLGDQGFFAPERKKPLPPFPKKIVVITSPTGAAIQDFLKVVARREYPLQVLILPVKVQGKEAAAEIAAAIALAQNIEDAEAIVLCRGGGSIEDLWAFNEERVAEAIFSCPIPVVTGIGHETDSTIADFCADCRCPTPTAAAERLIPDGISLRRHLHDRSQQLRLHLRHTLERLEQRLDRQRTRLGAVEQLRSRLEFRLRLSEERLRQAMEDELSRRERHLHRVSSELRRQLSVSAIELRNQQVRLLSQKLRYLIQDLVARGEASLAKQASLLQGLSPLATLARGYAVVRRPGSGKERWTLVTTSAEVAIDERLEVVLKDGHFSCQVLEKVIGSPISARSCGEQADSYPSEARNYSNSSPEKK